MTDKIKFIRDFISDEDTTQFVDWINNNIDKFNDYKIQKNPDRLALRFGRDQVFWDTTHHSLELIEDILPLARKYFDKVCAAMKEIYNDPNDLYVASFWLAKQKSGSFIGPHYDAGDNVNPQFKHSGLIYLNSMTDGGELFFPKLKYYFKPTANDFVTFPSKGEDMIHEVQKITEDRYSILFWVTDNPYFAL
jgi:hypothetical protein